ncbi:MAG: sigma-70 family RNA polymerase sigma factor [Planctomycetota bacterium]
MSDGREPERDFERHAAFLRRLARAAVRPDEADDLVQDCLLAGLEDGPRDEAARGAWWRRVLRNRVAEGRRRDLRREARERRASTLEATPSVFTAIEHREAVRAVTEALTTLPSELYEVVRLRFFEELGPTRIAERLGLPRRTVRHRLETALLALRRRLERDRRGRRSLAVVGGLVADHALELGGWMAVKKVLIGVVVGVLTLGSIWWVVGRSEDRDRLGDGGAAVAGTEEPGLEARRAAGGTVPVEDRTPEPDEVRDPGVDRLRDVFGRVVDPEGRPIPGAAVTTRAFPWSRLGVLSPRSGEAREGETTSTAADGTFVLRHERGDVVELEVSHPDYSRRRFGRRVAGERVEIVLHPERSLRVRVRDDAGEPLERATVRLWREDENGEGIDRREGRTGADGEVVFDQLAPGAYRVMSRHVACTPTPFASVALEVAPGGVQTQDVVLPRGAEIRGSVRDESGAPVTGALVRVNWSGEGTETDGEGYFVCPGGPRDDRTICTLKVVAPGFALEQVDLGPGVRECDVILRPGDTVRGRCVDGEGRALAGVRVSMIGSNLAGMSQFVDPGAAVSDARGEFELRDVSRRTPHVLIFEAEGRGRRHLDLDPRPEGPGVIEIGEVRLVPGFVLSGRIVDTEGTPAADARVRLVGANADRAARRPVGAGPAEEFYGGHEDRRPDDLGRFVFTDLPAGSFELVVTRRGGERVVREIVIEEADPAEVEIVLAPRRGVAALVVDASGAPVKDLPVSLLNGRVVAVSSRTDAKGRVAFAGVPGGELTFTAGGAFSGYRPTTGVPAEIDGEVRIVVEREVRLEGRVIGPDDEALAGFEIEVRFEGGRIETAMSHFDGTFAIDGPAGRPAILELTGQHSEAMAPGMFTMVASEYVGKLEGVAAPASGLVLRAERAVGDKSLRVIVVDPEGRPVPGAEVHGAPHGEYRTFVADEEGSVSFRELRPIAFNLSARLAGERAEEHYPSETLKVTPADQTVRLALRPARRLTGRVELEDGSPAVKFAVTARLDGEEHYRAITDEDGRFAMTLVAGKSYVLEAISSDRTKFARKDDVTGTTVTVRIPNR